MTEKSIEFLMGIDHIDWLLDVLCKVGREGVTKSQFEDTLIEISNRRIKQRKSKSIEMYRSWLITLKLLNEMNDNRKYTLTERGENFCKVYSAGNKQRYEKMLSSYLFRNEKVGRHFKRYKEIIKERIRIGNPITKDEMKNHFQGESYRVLYHLSRKAGIITVTPKTKKLGIKKSQRPNVTLASFKNLIKKFYDAAIKNKNGLHLQKHYVEIYKIRDDILSYWGLEEPKVFDELFTKLLGSPLGKNIQIHSAAPQWFTDRKFKPKDVSFRNEEKIYVFMSINK